MDMDNPDPGETQSKRHVEIRQSELDTNKSRGQKQFINDCGKFVIYFKEIYEKILRIEANLCSLRFRVSANEGCQLCAGHIL
jgi:hypothetical protein